MRGNTKKIQYGIPASCSAPMVPPTATKTSKSTKQVFHQDFFFCRSTIHPPVSLSSATRDLKSLEVLDQSVFFRNRQLGTVAFSLMSFVRIAGLVSIIFKIFPAFFVADVGDKPDLVLIVDIVAAVERF